MAKLAPPEDHELAGRFLESKGLCLDLAREHTSAIAKNDERRQVRHHYEAIAKSFYCIRKKRRSLFQQVMLNKAMEQFFKSRHEKERLKRDLLVVYNDPHYSVDRRRAALQEINEFRNECEKLAEQQHAEVVYLSLTPGYHPSKSQRLISRFRREGRDKFFDRLDSVIRRYLKARVPDAQLSGSTPVTRLGPLTSLLQLLAFEWLRNKEELWRFLEACITRWEVVNDPNGIHQQNVIMHNICETGMGLDRNGNNVIDRSHKILPQVADYLQDAGVFVETKQSVVDCLRQRSSRNIRKAKAEFEQTDRVTPSGAVRL